MNFASALLYSLLMNGLPLVEVIASGRSPAILLLLYWFETVLLLVTGVVRIVLHRRATRRAGHYVSIATAQDANAGAAQTRRALGDENAYLRSFLSMLQGELVSAADRCPGHSQRRKRQVLVRMQRAISPQRDVIRALFRHDGNPCIAERTAPYFRDIYDHLTRVYESIEAGRDLVSNCMDAYHSTVSQYTNDIMKSLTMLSAFMLPMTFLTGFFGMNFDAMPFKSHVMFALSLLVMFAAVPAAMFWLFRRLEWLGEKPARKKPPRALT